MDRSIFIGNSYTFYNDMPKLFEELANKNGHKCEVISVTKGGRRLFHNIETDDDFAHSVKYCANNGNYDVLFLQDQSLIAIDDPEGFERGVAAHVELFSAKKNVLYATWGRKEGSPQLAERSLTSREMTDKLAKAYGELARKLSIEVSNVGLAFAYVSERYPNIELYNPDLSHPSYEGSCLAALVHYQTVYGEVPGDISPLKLGDDTEKILLECATNS